MYKQLLKVLGRIPLGGAVTRLFFKKNRPDLAREVFGLHFSNPIGVGSGFDRDAELFDILSNFGFSFVEIGPMNDRKILQAIEKIKKRHSESMILSVCISKDHLKTFSLAYDFADMFVLDIPDTRITETLSLILDTRLTYETYKPVLVKITHDMCEKDLETIIDFCLMNGVDGAVVAKKENVEKISSISMGRLPLIGYGGIRSKAKAKEMLDSGASLVEITTGMLLDGPGIGAKILKNI